MADLTPERLAELRITLRRRRLTGIDTFTIDDLDMALLALDAAARGLQHDRLVAALREARGVLLAIKIMTPGDVYEAADAAERDIDALLRAYPDLAAELRARRTQHDRLVAALRDYHGEYENPVPDYGLRKRYRDKLFALLRDLDAGR